MFTTSVARAARCSYSCPHNPAPARRVLQQAISTKPNRQRRHSSSKASAPPDGASRAQGSASSTTTSSSATVAGPITTTRGRGRKPKVVTVTGRLPMVPTTQHLHPNFINLSSFFSLHRPISVDQRLVLPPVVTGDQFASIFEPKATHRYQMIDVLQTLEAAVINFDGAENSNQEPMIQVDSPTSKQYSRANIPESIPIAKLFDEHRPFVPPPVPQSIGRRGRRTTRETGAKGSSDRSIQWKTTIVLTEHTLPSGQKSYSASGSPLERMPTTTPTALPAIEFQEPESIPMTMVEFEESITRGRIRWRRNKDQNINAPMVALSVKRQRKTKMKKKKFKKLMKRTRNLRRKLGKL